MRTKLKGLFTLLLALAVQWSFAQEKKVTGKVTDASSGEPLPGVNIVIEGTQKGTVTDFDGNYSITASPDDVLVFSYVGYKDAKEKVGNRSIINVALQRGEKLETIVFDISGEKKNIKTITYVVQTVKSDKLEISDISNAASAISGKIAGAQVWEQAGSKLGSKPKIRFRGRISLSSDTNPLYVVDGVPVNDPSVIDPDDIQTIEVLKGPNATAIYGQRGENGVVYIATKSAKKGKFGVNVNSKITFENIAYLPKYQNWYGQGARNDGDWLTYDYATYSAMGPQYPEWADPAFQGVRFNRRTLYDESWGPKFDGEDVMPWYAWIPGSPYFGQTTKWEAKPNNVKNFYNTGVFIKNNISLYSATKKYSARLSFSNLSQKGTIPYSTYNRYYLNSNFKYNVSKKFTVGLHALYSQYKRHGDFNDEYGNQTSGSFNAWFARDLDMSKQKELINLKTPEGYLASWNWWGPFYLALLPNYGYPVEQLKRPVFWFNHYTWLDRYDRNSNGYNLVANVWAKYKINNALSLKIAFNRAQNNGNSNFHLPYEIEYSSAHDLYTTWINSFGLSTSIRTEDNYNGFLYYKKDLTEDINFDGLLGTTLRDENRYSLSTWMDPEDPENGLVIPDVYRFSNTKKPVVASRDEYHKMVYSIFGKTTFAFKNMLFLEITGRQDWSSALPEDNNGYFYPSVGLTWNFSDMDGFSNSKISNYISSGKFRIGWAQVGSDVSAHLIYSRYPILSDVPYNGYATLLTPSYTVDPDLKPALNSSFEIGTDLKFLDNRAGLSFTYYYEKRKDEIILQAISAATGYNNYLTNGGQSHRSGIELTLDGTPIKTKRFSWNLTANVAYNKTIVDDVPGDNVEMLAPGGKWWSGGDTWGRIAVVHKEHKEWGQLKGYDIRKDENGNYVLSSEGLYLPTKEQVYFGSVLPHITGGFTNTFKYKDFSFVAHFTFQKGGKFFSGSEVWGYYSGLYEETGMNGKREDGVNVSGVDTNGQSVSHNVEARTYYKQFHNNNIAGPFIHDASYLKLRELSLTYTLPKSIINKTKYLKGASISLIGTNVWLIAVAKDNYHRWDPSELSQIYGEDAQLPGTRRYGVNIKINF